MSPRFLLLGLACALGGSAVAVAVTVRPTAVRIAEVAAMLPAQPAPIGAPVSDRAVGTAIA